MPSLQCTLPCSVLLDGLLALLPVHLHQLVFYSLERGWSCLQTRLQVFHCVCLLFSVCKNIKWALCQDLFLRGTFLFMFLFQSHFYLSTSLFSYQKVSTVPGSSVIGSRGGRDCTPCLSPELSIKLGTQRGSINHLNELM